MASASELISYQGNAALGGAGGVVSPDMLNVINKTTNDIMLLDRQQQMALFNQKIQDRDSLRQMLANGIVPPQIIDKDDRKYYDEAEKKVIDSFSKIKNLGDSKAIAKFYEDASNLKDVVSQAKYRALSLNALEQQKAQSVLPSKQKDVQNFIDNQKKKSFWDNIDPYQQTHDWDKDRSLSYFKMSAMPDIISDDGQFTLSGAQVADYGATLKAANEDYLTDEGNYNQQQLLDKINLLPTDQKDKMIDALNKQLANYNTLKGISDTDPNYVKIDYDPLTHTIKELPNDFAAKFAMGSQGAYTVAGKQVFNKDYVAHKDKEAALAQKAANDAAKNRIDLGKLALAREKLGIDRMKANAQIKRWDAATKGTAGEKSAALNFANNLYSQLQSLADSRTGVITPDKVRQLTGEQLKYLGSYDDIKTEDSNGNKITKTGLTQLSLGDNDLIELKDGVVRVMKDAKFDKKSGRWIGKWDNSRTTTISNIATNRINEEVKMSSGKEINSYTPLDAIGSDNDGLFNELINLNGNEDPSSLTEGQTYNLNGVGKVIWDGKNLIKQK